MSAVGFVHVQNSVGSGAGTGERVEDDVILRRYPIDNALKQQYVLFGIKSGIRS